MYRWAKCMHSTGFIGLLTQSLASGIKRFVIESRDKETLETKCWMLEGIPDNSDWKMGIICQTEQKQIKKLQKKEE